MLDELKNLNYHGTKDGLLFFICDVIGKYNLSLKDAEVICAHAPGKRHISANDLLSYCVALGWVGVENDILSTSPEIERRLEDKDRLNEFLIESTVEQLFAWEAFDSNMFSYDAVQCCFSFKNDLLPLSLSCVRNMLISQGFLIPFRDNQGSKFYIPNSYEPLIAKFCRVRNRLISLAQLKRKIENDEMAGEKAELFVLSFEEHRIGHPLCESIKRISEIDVSAGYDIISFDSDQSIYPNRLIEVKAVASSGFFWSKNEYEIARLNGDAYFLYLVDLSRIDESDYVPEMIQNPAKTIMKDDGWFVEAQSFSIKRI